MKGNGESGCDGQEGPFPAQRATNILHFGAFCGTTCSICQFFCEPLWRGQRVDYREVLNEQEYAFFDHLRQVRKSIAEQQGEPVYAVFTNEHLAGMVKKPPKTLKDIAIPPGVGEARVKQFGEASLKVCLDIAGRPGETQG